MKHFAVRPVTLVRIASVGSQVHFVYNVVMSFGGNLKPLYCRRKFYGIKSQDAIGLSSGIRIQDLFHGLTIIRRMRNKIEALLQEVRSWTYN
ncbi:hypothetical protein RJT34_33141 [Clitoria ternatea]|uniref:Uncharacterized protein n=1 Tax=Clitoria ternatea TaxID=43366 RepID=A0AAN9EY91_CLITE